MAARKAIRYSVNISEEEHLRSNDLCDKNHGNSCKIAVFNFQLENVKETRGFNKHRRPKKLVGYFAQKSRLPFLFFLERKSNWCE